MSGRTNMYGSSYESKQNPVRPLSRYHHRPAVPLSTASFPHRGSSSYRTQPQHQQQLEQQRQSKSGLSLSEISEVCRSQKFMERRSPFFVVNTILDKAPIYTATQSRLNFQMGREALDALCSTEPSTNKAVHLRLYCTETESHYGWNQIRVSVHVNSQVVQIDSRTTNSGVKKKGLQIVKPVDITQQVCAVLSKHRNLSALPIHVEVFCQSQFNGILLAELVRVRSIEEVLNDVITADAEKCLGSERPKAVKVCEFCGSQEDLLRCSRCKNTWYCGQDHQSQHWDLHSLVCQPPRSQTLSGHVSSREADDEVKVVDSRVCLRCPLSVGRIKIAARGSNCNHPQCFDLATFLGFCNQTGIWQCPICTKKLAFSEIQIDLFMNKVLREVSEDIYQVSLLPDGNYTVISLEEEKRKDEEDFTSNSSKRRKIANSDRQNGYINRDSTSNHKDIAAHEFADGVFSSSNSEDRNHKTSTVRLSDHNDIISKGLHQNNVVINTSDHGGSSMDSAIVLE